MRAELRLIRDDFSRSVNERAELRLIRDYFFLRSVDERVELRQIGDDFFAFLMKHGFQKR